jgi:hypothetical protein
MKKQSLLLWSIYIFVGLAFLISSQSIGQTTNSPSSGDRASHDKVKNQTADEYFSMLRNNQVTGMVDPKDVIVARGRVAEMIKQKNGNALNLTWGELGPDNFGGRTRSIIYDVASPNTLFAAAVTGGIWKTTSGGSSWFKMKVESDVYKIINATCLTQTPDGTIYAGTGEYFEKQYTPVGTVSGNGTALGGVMGRGLYKSVDRENFVLVPGTAPTLNDVNSDWAYISKLACTSSGRVFAATNKGLRYSDNGGTNWTMAKNASGQDLTENAYDIKIGSNGIIVAVVGKKVYISANGDPSSFVTPSIGGAGNLPVPANLCRVECAIAPSNPDVIYAVAAKLSGALENIYVSNDKGVTWSVVGPGGSASFNIFNSTNDLTSGLGMYDIAISVFPNNPNQIIVGGVNMWRGVKVDNGYYSWEQVSDGIFLSSLFPLYVHMNHHQYVFHPSNPEEFVIATDGGIYMSSNGANTFQNLNRKYNVTQTNSVSTSYKAELLTGTTGNGTIFMGRQGNSPQLGEKLLNPDGGSCAISFIYPNVYFVTTPNCGVRRSIDNGANFSTFNASAMSGITGAYKTPMLYWESFNDPFTKDSAMFISFDTIAQGEKFIVKSVNGNYPFFVTNTTGNTIFPKDTLYFPDPIQSKMFLGANGTIWFTKQALDFAVTPTWSKLSNFSMTIQSMAISKDGDVLFAGTQDGMVLRFKNIGSWESGTANNVEIDTIKTFAGRVITSIATDPANNNHLVVTLGNYGNTAYVYESTDALANTPAFSSKQGNLPAMPVYASVIEMKNTKHVLIGTETGVFATDDISASSPQWAAQPDGIGDVPVYELKQQTMWWYPIVDMNDSAYVQNYGIIYAASNGRGVFECKRYYIVGIDDLPGSFVNTNAMMSVYPNPVSTSATILYHLTTNANVRFDVYDLMGRNVASFNAGKQIKGDHLFNLNATDLSNGTYVIHMTAGLDSSTLKLVVNK